MQTLGPNNPLVSMQQYSNTLTRMIELAGFKDANAFINTQVPPMPPAQPEQQKPDPAELLAQAEAMKAQNLAQKAIIDAETDRMKIIMDDDRNRDEAEAQIRLKAAELMAKYGAQVNIAEINAIMERDRETIRQTAKDQSQGLFTGNGNQTI
jgi:exoribonuclease R